MTRIEQALYDVLVETRDELLRLNRKIGTSESQVRYRDGLLNRIDATMEKARHQKVVKEHGFCDTNPQDGG